MRFDVVVKDLFKVKDQVMKRILILFLHISFHISNNCLFRWHFAYSAIIEEIVRRRKNNWNWKRMKKHRESVRAYKDAWLKKQTEKNLSSKDRNIIEVNLRRKIMIGDHQQISSFRHYSKISSQFR